MSKAKEQYQDNRRHNFTIIDNEILAMGFDVYEMRVYMELCHRSNGDKECWPSLSRLAKDCKISKPKLIKTIKSLEDHKVISVERTSDEDGKNDVNTYTILPVQKQGGSKPHLLGGSKPHLPGVVNDVYSNKTKREQEIIDSKESIREPENLTPIESPKPDKPTSNIHQLMFGAICEAFSVDPSKLTPNERSLYGKAAKQLCAAGRSPDNAKTIYDYCKRNFTIFSPMALTTHAAAALSDQQQPPPPVEVIEVNFDIESTIDLNGAVNHDH